MPFSIGQLPGNSNVQVLLSRKVHLDVRPQEFLVFSRFLM